MGEEADGVRVSVGFASEKGPRRENEDFAGAVFGPERQRRDVVAAIADGIGGAKGGRVAAETAVRGFLAGFCDLPETEEVRGAAMRVISALNAWIYSLSQRDPALTDMGCTFTALVLHTRTAHVLHVGDSRAYRLRSDRLTLLTTDHTPESELGFDSGFDSVLGRSGILTRALGVETEALLDYASHPLELDDRFLLCSDGVHDALPGSAIVAILCRRAAAEDAARTLVTAALDAGSGDNATALVIDVVGLPAAEPTDIGA